jgi:hypothetical protein
VSVIKIEEWWVTWDNMTVTPSSATFRMVEKVLNINSMEPLGGQSCPIPARRAGGTQHLEMTTS